MECLMTVTPNDVLTILRGEASVELQARFHNEAETPGSPLVALLSEVVDWSRQHLNANAPSPAAAGRAEQHGAEPGEFRVLNRAAFLEGGDGPQSLDDLDAEDLAACLRGTASDEITALVRLALDDPASKLSRLLKGLDDDES